MNDVRNMQASRSSDIDGDGEHGGGIGVDDNFGGWLKGTLDFSGPEVVVIVEEIPARNSRRRGGSSGEPRI